MKLTHIAFSMSKDKLIENGNVYVTYSKSKAKDRKHVMHYVTELCKNLDKPPGKLQRDQLHPLSDPLTTLTEMFTIML